MGQVVHGLLRSRAARRVLRHLSATCRHFFGRLTTEPPGFHGTGSFDSFLFGRNKCQLRKGDVYVGGVSGACHFSLSERCRNGIGAMTFGQDRLGRCCIVVAASTITDRCEGARRNTSIKVSFKLGACVAVDSNDAIRDPQCLGASLPGIRRGKEGLSLYGSRSGGHRHEELRLGHRCRTVIGHHAS